MAKAEEGPSRVQDSEIEQNYTYHPFEEVKSALASLGYGPSKMLVDAVYVRKDGMQAVGVLTVTEGHCRDHFGLFRGVDQGEAAGQTLILLHCFTDGIPEGQSPLLRHIAIDTENPAPEGVVLNMFVDKTGNRGNIFSGRANVESGAGVISRVEMSGRILPTELARKLIEWRRKRELEHPARFQLKP